MRPIIVLLALLLAMTGFFFGTFLFFTQIPPATQIPPDTHLSYNNFHWVKLTFYPERSGMTIVAKPDINQYTAIAWGFTPTLLEELTLVGITDNSSSVILPLSSYYKYIISAEGVCTFQIYPLDSSYSIFCNI